MQWKMSWKNSLPVIGIVCLGALLRLAFLGKNDLWYDEVATVWLSRKPFIRWNPPLYPFIMHIWIKLTGFSEWTIRLPSALFSIGSLVIVYRLSKKLFEKNTAMFCLILVAINPFHLWYAQEARHYTLALLLGLMSTYSLYLYVKENRKIHLSFYCLLVILGLYCSYFSLFLFAFQIIYVMFFLEGNFRKKSLFFLPIIFFLPWISKFVYKFAYTRQGFWIPKPTPEHLLISLENFIIGYNGTAILYFLTDILVILLLAIILGLARKKLLKTREVALCAILFFLPMLVVYVFSVCFFSIYLDRVFLMFTPYFYMLLALSLTKISYKHLRYLTLFVIIILCLIGCQRYFSNQIFLPDCMKHHVGVHVKEPFKPLARFILPSIDNDSCVIIGQQSIIPLIFYMSGAGNYFNPPFPWFFVYDIDIVDEKWERPFKIQYGYKLYKSYIAKADILKKVSPFKKAFFIGGDWSRNSKLDPNSKSIKKWLDQHMHCVEKLNFDGLWLFIYEKKD